MFNRFSIGDMVMAKQNPVYDREYIPESNVDRKDNSGCIGEVIDYSDSHGLCYKVDFMNGKFAWYEQDELIFINKG